MFKLVHKRLLILSSIALLILPNSFSAGLISCTVGLFSLWSFKVIKQAFLLLMSIRSNISFSTFSIICFPLMSILILMFLFVFLYVDVLEFLRILTYSSFVNLYMLDDLSAKVKVLSGRFIFFMSSFSWFWSWLFTFRSFMFFTNSINSDSKAASSFTGGGILKLRNPYLCWLFFFFSGVLKNCFPSDSFDFISIFSISYSL